MLVGLRHCDTVLDGAVCVFNNVRLVRNFVVEFCTIHPSSGDHAHCGRAESAAVRVRRTVHSPTAVQRPRPGAADRAAAPRFMPHAAITLRSRSAMRPLSSSVFPNTGFCCGTTTHGVSKWHRRNNNNAHGTEKLILYLISHTTRPLQQLHHLTH